MHTTFQMKQAYNEEHSILLFLVSRVVVIAVIESLKYKLIPYDFMTGIPPSILPDNLVKQTFLVYRLPIVLSQLA